MDDFFTVASFATFSSCTGAVVAVVGTVRHVFGWGPRWFGWLAALALAAAAYYVTYSMGTSRTDALPVLLRVIIVFINGSLIYASAFGVQSTVVARQPSALAGAVPARITFRSPW